MDQPHILNLQNATVSPYNFADRLFHGGIDAAISVPEGRMRKGAKFMDRPVAADTTVSKKMQGRFLFAGPLWSHFGHIFADSLHRLWAIDGDKDGFDGIVFVGVKGLRYVHTDAELQKAIYPPLLDDVLKLLRIDHIPVIYLREPTVFETLAVPEPGASISNTIAPFYRSHLARYQTAITESVSHMLPQVPDRIYYGRNHILHKGGILGGSYLETEMTRQGIVSIRPEDLSMAEQFAHLIGAKTVVFDEGSSVHPTELINRLSSKYIMLPRRPGGAKSVVQSVQQRVDLTVLARKNGITMLPDNQGRTKSPFRLTVYHNPAGVFGGLRRKGIVRGKFDADAYAVAEEHDLLTLRAKTKKIQNARIATLRALRQETNQAQKVEDSAKSRRVIPPPETL